MSDFKRVQIIFASENALARDKVVNTIHFRTGEVPTTFSDQDMANDVCDVFRNRPQVYVGQTNVEVRVYDLEDAPGPPLATVTRPMIGPNAAQAPREIALCLSFRGADNTPRSRGRIFCGPINASSERPPAFMREQVLGIASSLAGIGGTGIDWCVYSPTSRGANRELGPAFKPIKYAWVDDEWDTQRSRGLRPTERVSVNLDE